MLARERNAAYSSLRAKRSNPGCRRGCIPGLPRCARNDGGEGGSIKDRVARGDGAGMKVIALAGWSGAGKTTLLTRLIPYFLGQGLRVSVIKHAHHSFDVDVAGKDSWLHRQAGAAEVLVSSAQRWALMHELRGAEEPKLPELLAKLSPVGLVIVEGFKREPHRKIEVYRAANGKPALFPDD